MHLKSSYPKFQKKEFQLESSHENSRGLHTHPQGPYRTERGTCQCSLGTVLGSSKVGRRPLGVISSNTLCCSSTVTSITKLPTESSCETKGWNGQDGEGPLDIWAVIKPGNTKEKIAIFAAQQCAHAVSTVGDPTKGLVNNLGVRTASMKIKSCWEVEGSIAKRRKWSANSDRRHRSEQQKMLQESVLLPERKGPPSVHFEERSCREVELDGSEGGRTLSVVEIVANFEQMACDQQVDLSKPCPLRSLGNNALPKVGSSLADQPGRLPALEDRVQEGECVRVLDMVAKLDSECLKQQSEREAGSLSRSNSLRRSVGRVLLAGTEVCLASAQGRPEHLSELGEVSNGCTESRSPVSNQTDSSDPAVAGGGKVFILGVPFSATEATLSSCKVQSSEVLYLAQDGKSDREPVCPLTDGQTLGAQQEEVRVGSEPGVGHRQEPLPGSLFFSQPLPVHKRHTLQSKNTEPTQKSHCSQEKDSLLSHPSVLGKDQSTEKVKAERDKGAIDHERSQFPLRRMVSHEFLEMRFKVQLLLEPQQYMAFLPHHIMVKIFSLLPTKTLAALKCTCHYFKFIIESYGVRPADSRWVSDPRYKDDPCKQCKKRYGQGDVSLCRWHHKPYCQALPYGPGYWMCCHGSQKDTPGCNVGLHDNRWVTTFYNMAVYKKTRDEEDS
ncbi:F-box only protein 34 isoform X3 [Arapaima gigas]